MNATYQIVFYVIILNKEQISHSYIILSELVESSTQVVYQVQVFSATLPLRFNKPSECVIKTDQFLNGD